MYRAVVSLVVLLAGARLASAQEIIAAEVLAGEQVWEQTSRSGFWASAEYLLWWFKDSPVPVPLASTGNIGDPGTTVLLGAENVDTEAHHGGRFRAGLWLDGGQTLGIDAGFFFLGERSVSRTVAGGSDGVSIVNPFIDENGVENNDILAGGGSGFSTVLTLTNRSRLIGSDLNAVVNLAAGPRGSIDLLAGFRYLRLTEELLLVEAGQGNGLIFPFIDDFKTRNDFWGGQLGVRAEVLFGRLFVNASGQIALGNMSSTTDILGVAIVNYDNAIAPVLPPTLVAGGTYAQPTNIGRHQTDRFAVLSQAEVNVGYQLGAVRLSVGYTLLHANQVLRPGDQIDRVINTTQFALFNGLPANLVGIPRPAFFPNTSDFWAQGINFGLELNF